MSPKLKSKWFRWLSPGSIYVDSGKESEFDVSYGEKGDANAPLKGTIGSQPQFALFNKTNSPDHQMKGNRGGVTISGSRCCSVFTQFFSSITVEPVVFLYMLSTFSQYASFQDLVYMRSCLQSYPVSTCDKLQSPEFAKEAEAVQAMSSHLILVCTSALVLPSIFIAVYLGSWSDRFGRKWPIVLPPLGGLFGGFVSCIMSCMSYVSSISSEENRTVRISRLEAMIFLGGTVGPFLSGSLLEHIGHGFSFVFMLICYALAFLYAIFFVKEVHGDAIRSGGNGAPIPEIDGVRPHSAASSTSVVSSSLKSSTLEGNRHTEFLDLEEEEEVEQLLSPTPHLGLGLNLPDVARSATQSVYVDTTCHNFDHQQHDHSYPSPYQPLSSGSGQSHSNFEDGSSSASEDGQRNILKRSKESPHESHEDVSCFSRYFGSEHFFAALKTVIKKREGGRRAYLILTLVAGYIGMMITAGELDVAFLFSKGDPLKWSHKTFSYYFGLKYMLGTLVLLVGMPLFQHFQIRDSTVCIVGLISRMAGLVLYALSPNTTVAFMVPIVAICSFFSIPATRSLLSKLVSSDEQGKIFAFFAIMEDFTVMTASILFNSLYPLTRPILKGFIFLLAAVLLIVPILIMWFIGRRLSKLERLESAVTNAPHSPDLQQNNAL
ncbi:Proton-coupled folate transporter [Folsomia candida]|uniref:Proton-coupled folate transporter n=1 Tax=Folsomia candida TaxID=158441 RepID=A0A226F5A7_FOLCA|nr:Proton-coupled folate transporter [Folsomia candida]